MCVHVCTYVSITHICVCENPSYKNISRSKRLGGRPKVFLVMIRFKVEHMWMGDPKLSSGKLWEGGSNVPHSGKRH